MKLKLTDKEVRQLYFALDSVIDNDSSSADDHNISVELKHRITENMAKKDRFNTKVTPFLNFLLPFLLGILFVLLIIAFIIM